MGKSILFLGDMMFDCPMVNGSIISDEEELKIKNSDSTVDVEYGTYVESLDMVIVHTEEDFLCEVGEDFITGQNETGWNPNKIQCDSYFVDTLHDDNVITHDTINWYTKADDGSFMVFDAKCKWVVYWCQTEDELLECYPTAKKMKYESKIHSNK